MFELQASTDRQRKVPFERAANRTMRQEDRAHPLYVPHIGTHVRNDVTWFAVKARTGPGEYILLSDETPSEAQARQDLRRVRKQMFDAWHSGA